MKKIISLILFTILICTSLFGLTACAGSDGDVEALSAQVAELTEQLDGANDEIAELEAEKAEQSAEITSLKADLETLRAEKIALEFEKASLEEEITNLENPNSVSQMKEWLSQNGLVVESLGKKQVAELIKTAPANLRKVLELRQISAKSSIKKYVAMETAVCEDSRARGMFMFYGASRSGRFSGRIIQLQNLPQTHLPDLEVARQLVKDGMYDTLSVLYDSVPEVLSELIRTAFIPKPGYKFIVADFSAIEARVLSWLAGQEWRMEIFANGGDIYCATASRMFHCKVEKHGENAELRQKGKQAELGCGYGGGVGALKSMGALEMGIPEDELPEIVDAWRNANPKIVSFWYSVDRAAKKAIMQKTTTEVNGIKFICKNGMLFIELPSGRRLSYVKPKMGMNRFGSESITYKGTNGTTKKWERIETFGGKLTENIVQAIARDLLCYAMKTLSYTYMCAHVHDEIIIECSPDVSVDAICKQMSRTPSWAKGLVLNADGFECDFYKKIKKTDRPPLWSVCSALMESRHKTSHFCFLFVFCF